MTNNILTFRLRCDGCGRPFVPDELSTGLCRDCEDELVELQVKTLETDPFYQEWLRAPV